MCNVCNIAATVDQTTFMSDFVVVCFKFFRQERGGSFVMSPWEDYFMSVIHYYFICPTFPTSREPDSEI